MIKTNQLFDDMFTHTISFLSINVYANVYTDSIAIAFVVKNVCFQVVGSMEDELKKK